MLKIPLDKCRCLWYNTIMLNERKNNMNNRYLVRKEDNERICANIVAKLDELYKTNRTLIDQDSQAAWQAIEENWQYMRELEARLADRKNPKIYKEI